MDDRCGGLPQQDVMVSDEPLGDVVEGGLRAGKSATRPLFRSAGSNGASRTGGPSSTWSDQTVWPGCRQLLIRSAGAISKHGCRRTFMGT